MSGKKTNVFSLKMRNQRRLKVLESYWACFGIYFPTENLRDANLDNEACKKENGKWKMENGKSALILKENKEMSLDLDKLKES